MMERIGSMVAQGGPEQPGMPAKAPVNGTAQPSMGGDENEPQPNVTPEEQARYDQFVNNALKVIYPGGEGEGVAPSVIRALKGSDDPITNLATAAVSLITSLRDSAKKAGQPVPDDILFHGGIAVIEELAEVAEAGKIHGYSEEDREYAFYRALDIYRAAGEKTGDVDKEALTHEWGRIVEADRQGRLGEVLPGIESRLKKAG